MLETVSGEKNWLELFFLFFSFFLLSLAFFLFSSSQHFPGVVGGIGGSYIHTIPHFSCSFLHPFFPLAPGRRRHHVH